ncbi:MAG: putative YigZ family protein [Cognaticolwellia sp.]|jgi:uncharacterized YigZ family protein
MLLRRPSLRLRVATDPIKGSRFVATLDRAVDEAAAMNMVKGMRSEWPDATHHVFAWRIDGEARRSSDDGEPAGTSGPPILRRLDGAEASQTVIVVTRFYGGTKLGSGGLVRAYGQAAAAVLAEVQWVEEAQTHRLVLSCSYSLHGPLRGLLSRFEAQVITASWDTQAHLEILVPIELVEALKIEVQELGAGSIQVG